MKRKIAAKKTTRKVAPAKKKTAAPKAKPKATKPKVAKPKAAKPKPARAKAAKPTRAKRAAPKKPAASKRAAKTPAPPTRKPVFVSTAGFTSKDPADIVASNVSVVNLMFQEHFEPSEIAREALASYYVDYYLAQVENGGVSQFVYNSEASETVFTLVAEGLAAMGATGHAALFEKIVAQLRSIGKQRLIDYFATEYFGENATRDELEKHTDAVYALLKKENLTALNAHWLRSLPALSVLPIPILEEEIAKRAAALPNRKARIAAALANEPPYAKAIRALCKSAGQTLDRITAGDPTHQYEGKPTLAWHFLTDRGHHFMVEAGGQALMFSAKPQRRVAAVKL